MPNNIFMPTRSQLLHTYKSIIDGRSEAGTLKKLPGKPAGVSKTASFKNVGIKNMPGREDLFYKGMDLVVKNTNKGKTTWFDAGPMPLF